MPIKKEHVVPLGEVHMAPRMGPPSEHRLFHAGSMTPSHDPYQDGPQVCTRRAAPATVSGKPGRADAAFDGRIAAESGGAGAGGDGSRRRR